MRLDLAAPSLPLAPSSPSRPRRDPTGEPFPADAGRIDEGERSGVPREDGGSVITVYGDSCAIARFTGNEGGLTGRAILCDGNGEVVFFDDRGYSIGAMNESLLGASRPLGSARSANR